MQRFPILRVLGIIAGGISLLLLSVPAFDIQFTDVFKGTLDALSSRLDEFFKPLELAIAWAAHYVGWNFHPAKYWHHAFVLLWLMHGSLARNYSRGEGWGSFLFQFVWGFVTALAAGAMTGTVPLNSGAMLMWPVAGFMAFSAGVIAWDAARGEDSWWWSLLAAAGVAPLAYLGYAITKPITLIFPVDVPSHGLLLLAGVVGFVGLGMFLFGLYAAAREGDPIDNPATGLGLDIIGAFGVAITLAAIGFIPMPT